MITIGVLAREFKLSRSALLYYDRIGLLKPSARTPANYRVYTEDDRRRLEKICLYRQAGLDLKAIAEILQAAGGSQDTILERQIEVLNQKIKSLHRQQHLMVSLLKDLKGSIPLKVMDKRSWVRLLGSAGMDEQAMADWHQAFERLSPEAHQSFLESLGISPEEISAIRHWSHGRGPGPN